MVNYGPTFVLFNLFVPASFGPKITDPRATLFALTLVLYANRFWRGHKQSQVLFTYNL